MLPEDVDEYKRGEKSYRELVEQMAEVAANTCHDNCHDMGASDAALEAYVGTHYPTYVDMEIEHLMEGLEVDSAVSRLVFDAMREDVLEATQRELQEQGFTVYEPLEGDP